MAARSNPLANSFVVYTGGGIYPATCLFKMLPGTANVRNPEPNPASQTILTFALAIAALLMLVLASRVGMPLRAILIAVAFSDIIFLVLLQLGHILPGKRR
jgi:hypothetical protein